MTAVNTTKTWQKIYHFALKDEPKVSIEMGTP